MIKVGKLPVVLLGSALAMMSVGCSSDNDSPDPTPMPNPPAPPAVPDQLQDGWNEIVPGGETICSRGTEFAYFVRKGSVNKVVVDFIGGGACWNQQTCSVADAIFNPTVDNVRDAVEAGVPFGFYDDTREDNPFRDWYHIVIPYCTGDIHWGDNVITYGEGDEAVTINHKGAVNSRAVLQWMYDNFEKPEQIFVTGCSAGSYGSVMWAPHIAEHYPESKLYQFGDSGAGIITQSFFEDSFPSWNAESAFPTWITGLDPAEVNVLDLNLGDLYVGLVNHYPDLKFSQYNTTFDENQTFYFQAMGGGDADEWSQQMLDSMNYIEGQAPGFSSFIPTGEQHCIVVADNFYTVNVDGIKLTDWLNDMINDKPIDDLACSGDCTAPTP